ncbi:DUF5684 domain-containing protein [Lysinibacter sp. HNR]|uniref:DUF5684 domain-containing protein n=1 Tax=Lysinibacter sp. HNR TaxID=3031408 RepID=UPI002435AD01|nr:DUF5684 domain-containing protein [Lysinibacter sp. HNR]WGD36607.1 DUF5684 domain-containing protein [Lysinibacter sp. HNR]
MFTLYDSPTFSRAETWGIFALFASFFLVILILAFAFYIITAIFTALLFTKAGVDGKWRAWVPIYNTMIMLKLGDINPWWWFIGFVPFGGSLVLAVFVVMSYYRINLKLGKSPVGFTILAALLPFIWLIIISVDKSRWNAAAVPAPGWSHSILADRVRFTGVPNQGYLAFR